MLQASHSPSVLCIVLAPRSAGAVCRFMTGLAIVVRAC